MGAEGGSIDQHASDLAQVRRVGQQDEKLLEAAGADPSAQPVVDGIPGAELAGQVSPRNARPCPEEDGLEEHPIGQLGWLATGVLFGLFDKRSEDHPMSIGEHVSHGVPPQKNR